MNTSESESSRPQAPGLQLEVGGKPRRRLAMRWLVLLAVSVAAIAATGVWLYAQPRLGTGTFGPTGANPAYIVVNAPTAVTFTSQITDRQLKKRSVILLRLDASGQPTEILGRLNDDGRRGDLRAADNTYTFQTTLNEPNIGKVGFRVAARFKPGSWREPEPDDDDWDTELTELAADRVTKRDRLSRLLRKLDRYTLSDVFYVTVDPFALPPDPGEAGKQTLEGIDSDSDGVRDDVQRYIGLTYPNSPRKRAALLQLATVQQQFIINSGGDVTALKTLDTNRDGAGDCLEYVFGASNAASQASILKSRLLNTIARVRAFSASDRALGGGIYFLSDDSNLKAGCTVDPDQLTDG